MKYISRNTNFWQLCDTLIKNNSFKTKHFFNFFHSVQLEQQLVSNLFDPKAVLFIVPPS